ncbi:ParB/RepB/Spo0J family partition protein [Leptolyngbya sp. PL-A3]|uniref:ParB/RepB/Spo0J family partition protein n=1 Tax=Leptolyngbya sp. PL-A3 TaxID=2933911 RepID=UPI0032995239
MTKSNAAFELKGKSVLGRLISTPRQEETQTPEESDETKIKLIPIDAIVRNESQPRQYFSEESIESLAASLKKHSFRGAINVRHLDNNTYEIIAGERRWRAAKKAGLTEVPCIIDDYTDEEALEFALVENLQREDLSKLEETEGVLQLIETKFGISREQAITIVRSEGHPDKSRSNVAPSEEFEHILSVLAAFNIELQTFRTKNLRTLDLPDELKEAHLTQGLSYLSALELSKVKDEETRTALLKEVLAARLSFREVKKRVQEGAPAKGKGISASHEPSLFERVEDSLKKAKKAKTFFEKPQKKKRLERLLKDLEALLKESEDTENKESKQEES